ncbi:MAG: GNAT family N-acetyltransferase [Spirochaetota bacterium]
MKEITYSTIPCSGIQCVRSLWDELRTLHHDDSVFFKDYYRSITFEKRMQKFLDLPEDRVLIDLAANGGETVGYCISSMDDDVGQIDSICIAKPFRHAGIGTKLVDRALSWLKESGCKRIQLSVAEGHEYVIDFYKRFGFVQRMIVLEQIPDQPDRNEDTVSSPVSS